MLPIDRTGTLPYTDFAAHSTCNSLRCFGAAGNKSWGSANALDNFFNSPESLVAGGCHTFVPARIRSHTSRSGSHRHDRALLAEEKRPDRLNSAYLIFGGEKTAFLFKIIETTYLFSAIRVRRLYLSPRKRTGHRPPQNRGIRFSPPSLKADESSPRIEPKRF
jgi:hypothetical protein